MSSWLLPCPMPWCGSTDVRVVENFTSPGKSWRHVQCQRCESAPNEVWDTDSAAISAWNNRPTTLAEVERAHILSVLDMAEGNVSETARCLGVHRRTLQRKLRRLNLDRHAGGRDE